MDDEWEDQAFARMSKGLSNPALQACIRAVEGIVGYELDEVERAPFLRFHAYLNREPVPDYLARWQGSSDLQRWYHQHVDGILGDTQNALAAVCYHRNRLVETERAVRDVLAAFDYRAMLGDGTLALFNTRRWDFEYHSFLLAMRRCLDYLASSFAAYFQQPFNSFRRLPKFLNRQKEPSRLGVAEALRNTYDRHSPRFAYLLSESGSRSVRDRIAHYQFVSVGCLNLNRDGLLLAGSDQPMGSRPKGEDSLETMVVRETTALRECLADFIDSFVEATAEAEGNRTAAGAAEERDA
jgi:hypothetical protein